MRSVGQHWIWHESGVPCHWVSGQRPGTQNESTPMNIKNVAVALVTLIASSAAQAQQAVQWRVEDGGNGHWHGYSPARLDWNAAEQAARVSGGHLATITSSAENAFAASLGLPSDLFPSAYWTGGRRPSAGAPFGWITGEPWSFTNWDRLEPNGCCGTDVRFVVFRVHAGSLGRWDDTSIDGNAHPQWSLIEWSADCNNDGIVDYGQILQGQLADTNQDGIPDICQQPTCADADIYRDFNVNGADLGILISQWGPNTPLTESDLNHDGVVNGADLTTVLGTWGACGG